MEYIIHDGYDEKAVTASISRSLDEFYTSLIAKIDEIDITRLMARKNPYLYRAKAMQSAQDIVDSVMQAFISSSEETIFGNVFFEPLAVAASGGEKSIAEGVDLEVRENGVLYAVAVKSGTSVFNADSKKRQEQNFTAAKRLATQGHLAYEPVIGYGYGKKRQSRGGRPKIYVELAGADFWEALTGDCDFYKKIIRLMGTLPEQYLERFRESYDRARNRLVREFTFRFCRDDGAIDWEALVEYNSGHSE